MISQRTWRVLFAALFVASIYFLLTPAPPTVGLSGTRLYAFHKVGHFLMFSSMGFTLTRAYRGPRLYAWLALVAWGATSEFLQNFVPGRGPAVTDVLLDSASALTAFWRPQPPRSI